MADLLTLMAVIFPWPVSKLRTPRRLCPPEAESEDAILVHPVPVGSDTKFGNHVIYLASLLKNRFCPDFGYVV